MADAGPSVTVEAELRAGGATAQLARFRFPAPLDTTMAARDDWWLDLCLTPRPGNARARFAGEAGGGAGGFDRIGTLFAAPPGQRLHARSDRGGEQRSMLCQLDAAAIARWLEEAPAWRAPRPTGLLDLASPALRQLMLRLAQEARAPGFASAMLAELVAGQIAIELARAIAPGAERGAAGGLSPGRLRRLDERLAADGAAPTLGELAAACDLSVRQLTRGFRASRGCSIGAWVARAQAARAARMLAAGRPVKAIAAALGFASPSAFAQAFRRVTGESPRAWRERLRRG